MKQPHAIIGFLTASAVSLVFGCASVKIEPNNYIVWDGEPPYHELHPCSHEGPPAFEETWKLTDDVVSQLEADLPKLLRQKATKCCLIGWKIDDLNEHQRTYYGIVVNGKSLVYISTGGAAFCDCGPSCWAVLYDPSRRHFFGLRFGGIA